MNLDDSFQCSITFGRPLGMVINPDGVVSKVTAGGQAEAGGIRTGCRIIAVDGAPVDCLDDLKEIIAACKTHGDDGCCLFYTDVGRSAVIKAEVARSKAEASALAATAMANELTKARQRAEEVAKRAALLCKRPLFSLMSSFI